MVSKIWPLRSRPGETLVEGQAWGGRTHYEPGASCWTDPATTDPEGAKAFYGGPFYGGPFYGGLFGREAEDLPAGDAAFAVYEGETDG